MRIHYLQHVRFEGLGYIKGWLQHHNHRVSSTLFYEENFHLPDAEDIDALIVMGGPMGVYDEEPFPWLKQEKTFIKSCIQSGKKVLGICLGAQLIADYLGSKVRQAQHKEIGWFPVMPAQDAKTLPWFYELFKDRPTVFHWHGNQFDIPGNSPDLLFSQANAHQAFCYHKNVIGLQFHLEITPENLQLIVQNGLNELAEKGEYIQDISIPAENNSFITQCNKLMNKILLHWIRD